MTIFTTVSHISSSSSYSCRAEEGTRYSATRFVRQSGPTPSAHFQATVQLRVLPSNLAVKSLASTASSGVGLSPAPGSGAASRGRFAASGRVRSVSAGRGPFPPVTGAAGSRRAAVPPAPPSHAPAPPATGATGPTRAAVPPAFPGRARSAPGAVACTGASQENAWILTSVGPLTLTPPRAAMPDIPKIMSTPIGRDATTSTDRALSSRPLPTVTLPTPSPCTA